MKNFIGRQRELRALEKAYNKDSFQMAIIYGRRRVGKSTLIQKFVEGKRAVFYTAIRSSSQKNLELMGRRVLEVLAPSMSALSFRSYEEIFSFLTKQGQEQRLVFVIDELPYLAEQNTEVLSILQKYIDTEWLSGKIYLILCGSSISFMEEQVLSEKSPLFGRRTMQLHLNPFSYREAADFVPAYSPEEKAICYGVTGGVAKYLSLFEEQKSLDENIRELFFDESGYLYEEPENLLTQEFRNIATYSSIIEAVAAGRTRLSDIADLTHLESSTVVHAAKNLIATGILKREQAITDERNKKKNRYILADSMFRFWYRFLPNAIDAIALGKGRSYYDHIVKPRLSDYMGEVFENICREYTLEAGLNGTLSCFVTRVGKWWGTNPAKREETDIDVVGLDETKKLAVLGECKFKNEVIDKKIFEQLRERNGLINHQYRVVQYLLFSKSGFSDWILKHRESEAIKTVTLAQMYTMP